MPLQLRSIVRAGCELELALADVLVPEAKADEVGMRLKPCTPCPRNVELRNVVEPFLVRSTSGEVAVDEVFWRWCSDGFEIKCDSGQTVTATFTKDCCDREILAHRAWEGKGLTGEPVREMLIEAVKASLQGTSACGAGPS